MDAVVEVIMSKMKSSVTHFQLDQLLQPVAHSSSCCFRRFQLLFHSSARSLGQVRLKRTDAMLNVTTLLDRVNSFFHRITSNELADEFEIIVTIKF